MNVVATPSVGGKTPDFAYTTAQGEPKQLSEFWTTAPTLILWLRHFG